MPFLSSSRSRKKKSYLNDENDEESTRRREMIKQKLYAEHMIDPDETGCDDYLERRLGSSRSPVRRGSRSPVRRGIQRAGSNRRIQTPNYIDPSGSLRATQDRKPPRRAFSEQSGRKISGGSRALPRRTNSHEISPNSSSRGEARFSMAPHPTISRQPRRMNSRYGNQHSSYDEGEGEEGEMMLASTSPVGQRRPPSRRRRPPVTSQTIENHADTNTRFGPPRRTKSGSRSPRSVATMENSLDYQSDHSKSSKENSQKSFGRGVFRRKSLSTKNQTDISDHTSDSQKSWFTSGSAGTRSKEDIYNSALHRAKERQALKNNRTYHRSTGGNESIATHIGRVSLSEQLSQLPKANDDSDDDYDEDDEESPSIFGSIISKIESIYDSTIN